MFELSQGRGGGGGDIARGWHWPHQGHHVDACNYYYSRKCTITLPCENFIMACIHIPMGNFTEILPN